MKELTKLISGLNKEEIRNFKIFSNRIDSGEEKKVVKLFDVIKEGKLDEDDEGLVKVFFPAGDKNPFYRLKNRLFEDIERSLVMLHADNEDKDSIYTYLMLAHLFEKRKIYELTAFYLHKAERKALRNDYFDLLDVIYDYNIKLSTLYHDINPQEYIEKYNLNNQKVLLSRSAAHATILINNKLRKSNFSDKEAPEETLHKIIEDLHLANNVVQLDTVRLSNHECIRDMLLLKKDFIKLEEFLIKSLEEFENDKLFNENNYREKLSLIVWITNTLNKNKNFPQSAIYNEILYQELQKFNKRYYNDFIFSYYQGLTINFIVNKKADAAILLLEELKQNKDFELNNRYALFLNLNLVSLYFIQKNFNKSVKHLVPLLHKEFIKQFNDELNISVLIVEILIQYEMNEYSYVLNKIAYIERSFKELLVTESFAREKAFINIIKYSITKDNGWKNTYTLNKVNEFLKMKPHFEFGSNEIIDYNIWINSKIMNKDYYQLYLQTLTS